MPQAPEKPLTEALLAGGLEALHAHMEDGGRWPRITTASLAKKEGREGHKEMVDLAGPLGSVFYREDIGSLVVQYGLSEVLHEAFLHSLATYIRNGGSVELLRKEPANAANYNGIMKDGRFRFSMMPVFHELSSPGGAAKFADCLETPGAVAEVLFGGDK